MTTKVAVKRSSLKSLARVEKLAAKYVAEGLSRRAATEKAYKFLRDNPRKTVKAKAAKKK